MLLEDTLEERDVPFPREAIKVEDRGDMGIASLDYIFQDKEEPAHWRIWFLVDKTRALMAAYVSDPAASTSLTSMKPHALSPISNSSRARTTELPSPVRTRCIRNIALP